MNMDSEEHSRRILFIVWIFLLLVFLYLAYIPVDLSSYLIIGPIILVSMFILDRFFPHEGVFRVLYLILAAYLSVRYILWRAFFTLHFNGILSFTAALLLFLAELYGIIIFLLGLFVNINPLYRKSIPIKFEDASLPTVDIFVPTLNESEKILKATLLAAKNINYPKDKLRIYLLDDGGTLQLRNDPDLSKAQQAKKRHQLLKQMCSSLGVTYLTREKNIHAKAGNINEALKHSGGELILVLDADHIPTTDILERTVGWFQKDSNLALLQTPHFFVNPDPIEKNLNTFSMMPSENEMFYMGIQPGLDFWNSSFFCGSAAVLRRSALNRIGGLGTTSITEDAETALELHSRGFNSAYISHPLIAGLQPETFTAFIRQRMRWAQGMIQIFVLKCPLFKKGLRFYQKLCYLNSGFFWLFSYARVIFLLAPSAFLIGGLKIYDANLPHVIAYAGPHVLGTIMCSNYLYGRVRWPFISELYELMQSFFHLPAVTNVLINPKRPKFVVTPKGEFLNTDFISPLANVFYLLFLLIIISLLCGIWRWFFYPVYRDVLIITGVWEIFNLILMLGAIGALLERRQLRAAPRIYAGNLRAKYFIDDQKALNIKVQDISVGGASLLVDKELVDLIHNGDILIYSSTLKKEVQLPFTIVHKIKISSKQFKIGIKFGSLDISQEETLVCLIYGDSNRWVEMLKQREKRIGIIKACVFLIGTGGIYSVKHLSVATFNIVKDFSEILYKIKKFNKMLFLSNKV